MRPSSLSQKTNGRLLDAEYIARCLGNPKSSDTGWVAKCPAHDDRKPSLSIKDAEPGKVLVKCHAGCSQEAVIRALKQRGLWPQSNGHYRPPATEVFDIDELRREARRKYPGAQKEAEEEEQPAGNGNRARRIVDKYDYEDERGKLLYQVVRYDPKDFCQRRPDGDGGWAWNMQGVRRVLYRLPEVLKAKLVHVVEGEKDADTMRADGYVATTNAGGANAPWLPEFTAALRGKEVILVPDQDRPGWLRVLRIARDLIGQAKSIAIRKPAGGAKDISDWVEKHPDEKLRLGKRVEITKAADIDALEENLKGVNRVNSVNRVTAYGEAAWPKPLGKDALIGIVGDFLRLVEPDSEADPAALAIQFLVAFGNIVGRGPHYEVEASKHYTNLFAAIVGVTSKGRKGTAWNQTLARFSDADPQWKQSRVKSGLASGEGLIWQCRDPIYENRPVKEKGKAPRYEAVQVDPGEADKRLLIVEPEFARVLLVCNRETNTLSAILRQAWDTGDLDNLTKGAISRAHGAHFSLIAHITRDELRRLLSDTAATNGFANRFLWVCAKRSKLLPDGGSINPADARVVAGYISEAVEFARGVGRMLRTKETRSLWHEVYATLSEGHRGMLGAVTSRAEAQVTRLSCLYALLDQSRVVKSQHLRASLEAWRYCFDSAKYMFGDALGDPVADEILQSLRANGEGLTRNEIRDHFKRNKASDEIGRALATLRERGLASVTTAVEHEGQIRPTERWKACRS